MQRASRESAVLSGGVRYTSGKPLLQRSGQADGATIDFDAQGQAKYAVFTGAVHLSERTRATEAAKEPWSTRDLTAAKVEAALVVSAGRAGNKASAGVAQVSDVEAIGGARLAVVNNGTLAHVHGRATTELSADDLKAHLIAAKDAKQAPWLDTVVGRGNTMLHQAMANGVDQTCSGETLDAKFRGEGSGRASSANGKAKQSEDVDDVQSAVQLGHVTMTRRAPAKSRGVWAVPTGGSALGAAGGGACDGAESCIRRRSGQGDALGRGSGERPDERVVGRSGGDVSHERGRTRERLGEGELSGAGGRESAQRVARDCSRSYGSGEHSTVCNTG